MLKQLVPNSENFTQKLTQKEYQTTIPNNHTKQPYLEGEQDWSDDCGDICPTVRHMWTKGAAKLKNDPLF